MFNFKNYTFDKKNIINSLINILKRLIIVKD